MFVKLLAILYVPFPWVVPALLIVKTFIVAALASVVALSLLIVSAPTTVPLLIEINTLLLDSTCEKHCEVKKKSKNMV